MNAFLKYLIVRHQNTYVANTSHYRSSLNFFHSSLFCSALNFGCCPSEENLDCKVNDFNSADDGEAGEETHGASDETDLVVQLDLLVPLDLVEGGRVEEEMNCMQG